MEKNNTCVTDNPYLAGIPIEFESDEPWRKTRLSCSGAGRVEKNFDYKHLSHIAKFQGRITDDDEEEDVN